MTVEILTALRTLAAESEVDLVESVRTGEAWVAKHLGRAVQTCM